MGTPRTERMEQAVKVADEVMHLAKSANYAPVLHMMELMGRSQLYELVIILASDLVCSGYEPWQDAVDTALQMEPTTRQEAQA